MRGLRAGSTDITEEVGSNQTRYEPEAPIGCEPGCNTARSMWRQQARLRGMHDEYAEPEVTRKYGDLQMEPWVYQMWGMLGMRS